ncbi:MAG TPA: SDR family NAD(P)-dependent oxidoreductase [Polyangiaceae bacterium]|nr:SDR family NAD(P)-dependent oxidoreductase [Polyangiaceae bacterium]
MQDDRKIVITGGSSGLGLALAEALFSRGARLALVARDEAKLLAAREKLLAARPDGVVFVHSLDVGSGDLAPAFDQIASELGGIDVLVNSAGVLREGYFDDSTDDDFRALMDVNCFGTLRAIRAALPHLERSRGRILNVASVAALTGVFGYTAYCASKHALLGVSDALRVELAPRGILVQVACPGEFDSPMVEALDRTRTPENRAHTLALPRTDMAEIVRDLIRAMEGDRFLTVPGRRARLFAFGLRHFPGIGRRVGDRKVREAYVGPKSRGR